VTARTTRLLYRTVHERVNCGNPLESHIEQYEVGTLAVDGGIAKRGLGGAANVTVHPSKASIANDPLFCGFNFPVRAHSLIH